MGGVPGHLSSYPLDQTVVGRFGEEFVDRATGANNPVREV
jgi:hypothetical protein